jgi:Xaa-Pro aminopeptidase
MELINRTALFSNLSTLQNLPIISRLMTSSVKVASEEELAGFRAAQKLAFQCTVEAARHLRVGMTEKAMGKWMKNYLLDHGVTGGFHYPLAWFGERTRFKGFKSERDALPSDRRLTSETEPVIFDIAPILDGYVSDIGFAFSLAPNPELIESRKFLLELRVEIASLFSSTKSVAAIWKIVDEMVRERGYQNCHSKYIMRVLGHRVHKVGKNPPIDFSRQYAGLYSLRAYWALISRGFFPEMLSPHHTGDKLGLWAVEPHLGNREQNFGIKFEEVLVVEEDRAYWLQDDVPHMQLPEGLY